MIFLSKMRLIGLCAAVVLGAVPVAAAPQSPPPVGRDTKAARAVVKYALRLTRTDFVDAAVPDAVAAPQPPAVLVASPLLSTLDGDTATITVNGTDLSYSLSLSPTVQTKDQLVQSLWNMKLTGKALPGSTSSVTVTGASRIPQNKEAVLIEVALTDPTNGHRSVYRLQGTVTVTPPETGTP